MVPLLDKVKNAEDDEEGVDEQQPAKGYPDYSDAVIETSPKKVFKSKVNFKNVPTPATFSFIFGLIKQTLQFLQQLM